MSHFSRFRSVSVALFVSLFTLLFPFSLGLLSLRWPILPHFGALLLTELAVLVLVKLLDLFRGRFLAFLTLPLFLLNFRVSDSHECYKRGNDD